MWNNLNKDIRQLLFVSMNAGVRCSWTLMFFFCFVVFLIPLMSFPLFEIVTRICLVLIDWWPFEQRCIIVAFIHQPNLLIFNFCLLKSYEDKNVTTIGRRKQNLVSGYYQPTIVNILVLLVTKFQIHTLIN